MAEKECPLPIQNYEKVKLLPDYMLKEIWNRIGTETDWFKWLQQRDCIRDERWKWQCDTCVFADQTKK